MKKIFIIIFILNIKNIYSMMKLKKVFNLLFHINKLSNKSIYNFTEDAWKKLTDKNFLIDYHKHMHEDKFRNDLESKIRYILNTKKFFESYLDELLINFFMKYKKSYFHKEIINYLNQNDNNLSKDKIKHQIWNLINLINKIEVDGNLSESNKINVKSNINEIKKIKENLIKILIDKILEMQKNLIRNSDIKEMSDYNIFGKKIFNNIFFIDVLSNINEILIDKMQKSLLLRKKLFYKIKKNNIKILKNEFHEKNILKNKILYNWFNIFENYGFIKAKKLIDLNKLQEKTAKLINPIKQTINEIITIEKNIIKTIELDSKNKDKKIDLIKLKNIKDILLNDMYNPFSEQILLYNLCDLIIAVYDPFTINIPANIITLLNSHANIILSIKEIKLENLKKQDKENKENEIKKNNQFIYDNFDDKFIKFLKKYKKNK